MPEPVIVNVTSPGGVNATLADDNAREFGLDLALAKSRECRQIEFTVLIEGRGKVRISTPAGQGKPNRRLRKMPAAE